MTRLLSKFGVTLWQVGVDKGCDPGCNGEKHHPALNVVFPPKNRIKAMVRAPEGSDSIACQINVYRRAYDGDE